MSASSFTILWMSLTIEWHSVVFCSFGGIIGIAIGFVCFDGLLSGLFHFRNLWMTSHRFVAAIIMIQILRCWAESFFCGHMVFFCARSLRCQSGKNSPYKSTNRWVLYMESNCSDSYWLCWGLSNILYKTDLIKFWRKINEILTGICSALTGSGVDICSFAVLTLLFRINEKVASYTSVLLMALNAPIGFTWRYFAVSPHEIARQTWGLFIICS